VSKIISAPKDEIYTGKEISLTPILLENEDPELFEYFQLYEQKALEEEYIQRYWYESGFGPAPELGGIWEGGAILTPGSPHFIRPPNATITKIEYSWDNRNIRNWVREVEVRLVVYANGYTGVADITAYNKGIVTSGNGFLAKAQIQFQMRVGLAKVRLYKPPYISLASVRVYYQ